MSIVIDPLTLNINLNGAPIRDFPATGTILSVARGQPPVAYTPAFGRDAGIIGPAWWNISITVEASSVSDNWFEASLRAFITLKKVWESSATRSGIPIYSGSSFFCTTVPDVVYAADAFPMRTWVLTGKCTSEPSAGIYTAAEALTLEDVQNA